MLNTPRSRRGMVTAPHHLASEAGLRVLREAGNAIEATVAMAAALTVVYPHMTGIGGDGFWLVAAPGQEPVDRKSTRLNSVTNAHLVCRLLLEKKKIKNKHTQKQNNINHTIIHIHEQKDTSLTPNITTNT